MRLPYREDLTGKVFHELTVLSYSHNHNNFSYWNCKCNCGVEKKIIGISLKSGNTKTCGHWKAEFLKKRATHGKYGTRLYRVWGQMIQRCTNPNSKAFPNYGGRGITVCEKWKDFSVFESDMASSWKDGLTLDRVDNYEGYSKENCRWATPSEQIRNRRPRSEWKKSSK